MKKVFFDTNIVLDIILDRPDAKYARQILEYSASNEFVHIYTSYLTMANVAYVMRRLPMSDIKAELTSILKLINIISTDDMQILQAIRSDGPDFEDSLQLACAEFRACDVIITRNPDHFKDYTEIPVITPSEFVLRCSRT